jgi:mannose-6-phosphate isomerase-like protein (cupin superfamily)
MRLIRALSALALLLGAVGLISAQQRRAPEVPSWAPKLEPAQYTRGHQPIVKIADLLAKHKGQADWRETIVNDDWFRAEYISMAPGTKVSPRFHPDNRIWWIVRDGEIRFEIEGQEPFVATKGSMVQVPMQTIYSMEVVGDKPALRFEVMPARGHTMYPQSTTPPSTPGVEFVPVTLNRRPHPYGWENKPHINMYELMKDPKYRGSRFVQDDRGVSNVIYGYEKNLPPYNPDQKGHYHLESSEFWIILTGQISYDIEKVGRIIADEGDVVYVPPFTYHNARFYGEGPSTRLAINGYPDLGHMYDAH